MILDVLVFLLGVCTAGLLALACLPAVWARALRLTEERLSRLVPLSPEEIAAERDHLRAAHAVELRRTEQRLEASEADRAALRVAAARREAHIAAQDDAAVRAQVRIAVLDAEAAGLRLEVAGLWAEHGAEALALDGLGRLAERRLDDLAASQAERDALRGERDGLRDERDAARGEHAALREEFLAVRHELDRSRGSVAGLETRLIGAETHGEDLERDLEAARRDVAAAAARLAATAAERDAPPTPPEAGPGQAAEVEALKAELAFMVEQAHSAERRAADSQKAYEILQAGRAAGAPEAPAQPRDDAGLRAAIAALADEVLRSADAARTAEPV